MTTHANKQQLPTLGELQQLRAHYAAKILQIDAALDVMREAVKLRRFVARTLGAVRERVDGENEQRPAKGPRGGKSKSAIARAAKAARGESKPMVGYRLKQYERTPIARMRKALAAAGEQPLTRDALAAASKIKGKVGPRAHSKESAVAKSVGNLLAKLLANKEIRETPDGYVAHKLHHPEAAESNGDGARA